MFSHAAVNWIVFPRFFPFLVKIEGIFLYKLLTKYDIPFQSYLITATTYLLNKLIYYYNYCY